MFVSLLLGLALAGCQGGAGSVRPEEAEAERAALAMLAEGRATEAAYEFLRLAKTTADADRARDYRLRAVEALLDAGDAASAARVLDQELPGDLPEPDAYRRDVARAEIALLEGDPIRAVEILGRPAPPELPAELANRATRVRARALARVGNNLEAARTLLALEPSLATPEAVERNRRDAWEALTRVSLPALERARVVPPDVFGGWVELAIAFSSSFMDPESFDLRVAAWRGRFPGHPALESIVPELTLASAEAGRAPTRVALLLPLDGPFASAAQAVRDGFVAAWYTDDPTTRPAVSVHDSSGEDVWPVYRAAVEEGAEFVVGPLRRPLVSALAAQDSLAVPTLALNHASEPLKSGAGDAARAGDGAGGETGDAATGVGPYPPLAAEAVPATPPTGPDPTLEAAGLRADAPLPAGDAAPSVGLVDVAERAPTEGLFQFALSPEEEARQVAERAWFDGHARAVVIAPRGSWGERVSSAFGEAWEELGGEVVGEVAYETEAVDLSGPVAALLAVDASEQRYRELRRIVGSGLKAEARRRQDVDFVFMAAFPNQARQLRPQFKFHHAADVPVYSTSHVFAGVADPGADSDVDGVMFGDMPWALGATDAGLRRRVEALWPDSVASYLRLYAFGADAYSLVGRIGRLRAQAQAEYQGATGRLSVGSDNRIQRRLSWGRFEKGRPLLVDADLADPVVDPSSNLLGPSADPSGIDASVMPIVVPGDAPAPSPIRDR